MKEATPRIVILGGGFAGMSAALELEKALARGLKAEVVLVNQENFFLFTPMLHEVAASDVDITHIVNPVRKLLKRVQFFHGTVDSIDLEARRVRVSHGEENHPHVLDYDHLVLAMGTVTNFYDLPGLEERAFTMKSLGDAVTLRNKLIENLEIADFECCAAYRAPLLTVLVAGGGFSGVETAAAVHDFLREAVRFYPNLRPEMLRMVLVHSGPLVLPELGEQLGAYAQKKLAGRGVEIRVNTRVEGVGPEGVLLNNGETINAGTLVWTAGTSPNPHLHTLPCAKERGRVVVDECLQVPDYPGVWAAGDCASIPDPRTGKTHPPTAQHALREGRVLAANILATLQGRALKPFRFKTIGQLAAIGRRTGVARMLGVNFSGFIAWWMWRSVYLSKLPRLEKKLRVALDWTLDLLFSKDLVQLNTLNAPHSAELIVEQHEMEAMAK